MIKVIDGKRYNTDTAEHVFSRDNGQLCTDFRHRSKDLYRTSKGAWFIHHVGGPLTDMAVSVGNGHTGGSQRIEPVCDEDAYGFLEKHSDDTQAREAIEKYFADQVEDA